ncbi:hypothetical protein [Mucilaginibacter psychrotolerans]|uniref:Uncharacterized protein n=1 Tax=Mucilaginibacter psychrotolerans TaxID=1524096 RepID=A0A4Y8SHZ3_9SPHI|nr:hypothetical protein [Mucilaginibacter psychrotolerans]TFF38044.1 hypothetical protein E2R66_10710 [Mucilaginibacter psychrotolerans]
MNLETNGAWALLGASIENVKKVNVVNCAILMYTPATHVMGEKFPKPAWAIIIPSKNIEEGFVDHSAYVNYLRSIGFKVEPELYDMKDVVKAANDNEVIDWSRIISN